MTSMKRFLRNMDGKDQMDKKQQQISGIASWIINILFYGFVLVALVVIMQILLFSSFKIPSDSMKPELKTGDNILVCKPIVGARLFNVFASMRGEQTDIYRVLGIRRIERNDVLVFNFPHPHNWDKIEMHILKYYVKRCVGLPGDRLFVVNGVFRVDGVVESIGNSLSQERISKREKASFEEGVYHSFPYDSIVSWNIKEFGPLYIPGRGDRIEMNRTNYCLYKKVIEWEQQAGLSYKDSLVYLNNKMLNTYQFQKNYYFMAGDNGENSQDSRYWGLLPEEYIVGKAWIVWKSVDPYTGRFRWDRLMKVIH